MTKKSKFHSAASFIGWKVSLYFFLSFIFYSALSSVVCADEIKSRAAVVMDAATGRVLYAKNPDLRLLPASTTKLMTALVVVEKAKLSDVTTISKKAANTPATRIGFKEGDKVTIETLLYAALIKSANDAAVALAEAVAGSEEEFVSMMNTKALAIGLEDTKFINANGLPGNGQHITAYDLSKIMRQAIKYPVLKEILGTRMTEVATETGRTKFIKNTNKLLWSDEELLGGKTGFTRQARHCFVCAGEREQETIIVALLGSPSRELLWKESERLMDFGVKVINRSEEPVVYLSKDGGMKATNALYTERSGSAEEGTTVKGKKASYSKSANHKSSVKMAGKKKGNKTMMAKNKSKNKRTVKLAQRNKNKKAKKTNIAEMEQDGLKG